MSALLGLNVCTQEEEKQCREAIAEEGEGEKEKEWACSQCTKKKIRSIHPYSSHLFSLWRLKQAGYPFGKNDLPYQIWLDLGLFTEIISLRVKVWQIIPRL